MGIISLTNLFASKITRGQAPKNAMMLKVALDFTSAINNTLSLTLDLDPTVQNRFGIAGVQSVFVNNKNNSDVLIITFDNGYEIVAPAYFQGIFPVFFSGQVMNFTAYTSTGYGAILYFVNTREQAQGWTAKIPVAGTINVTGSTIFTEPASGGFTNSSAALVTPGTPKLIAAANANRRILSIRNPALPTSQNTGAPEPIYLSFGAPLVANALGTWELLPGESLPNFLQTSTQDVYFDAATAGHQVTCYTM